MDTKTDDLERIGSDLILNRRTDASIRPSEWTPDELERIAREMRVEAAKERETQRRD